MTAALVRAWVRFSGIVEFSMDPNASRRGETVLSYCRLCALCLLAPRSLRPIALFGFRVHHGSLKRLRQLFQEIFLDQAYAPHAPPTAGRILDAGANVGLATIFYRLRYPEAEIVCFEPDPATFQLLSRTLEGLERITLRNHALADYDGDAALYRESDGAGGDPTSTLTRSFREAVGDGATLGAATVRCTRLSTALHEGADILKLDIEGSERSVLAEASPLLARVGTLQMEYHDVPGNELDTVLTVLREAGMTFWLDLERVTETGISAGMIYARPNNSATSPHDC